MSSIVKVTYTNRRVQLKTSPSSLICDILWAACVRIGLDYDLYGLKYKGNFLDISSTLKNSGLPAGVNLDLQLLPTNLLRESKKSSVALVVEGIQGRYTAECFTEERVWDILRKFELLITKGKEFGLLTEKVQDKTSEYLTPVPIIFNKELDSLTKLSLPLSRFGVRGKSVLIRIIFRPSDHTLSQIKMLHKELFDNNIGNPSDVTNIQHLSSTTNDNKSDRVIQTVDDKNMNSSQNCQESNKKVKENVVYDKNTDNTSVKIDNNNVGNTNVTTNNNIVHENVETSNAANKNVANYDNIIKKEDNLNLSNKHVVDQDDKIKDNKSKICGVPMSSTEPKELSKNLTFDNLEKPSTAIDRKVKVYTPSEESAPLHSKSITDESTYELTVNHAKKYQTLLSNYNKRTFPAAVSKDASKKNKDFNATEKYKFDTIDIRFKFPDQTQLQSSFNSAELIGNVYAFIESVIQPTSYEWELFLPQPKKLLQEKNVSIGSYIPSSQRAVIIFEWKDPSLQKKLEQSSPVLKLEYLNQAKSIMEAARQSEETDTKEVNSSSKNDTKMKYSFPQSSSKKKFPAWLKMGKK